MGSFLKMSLKIFAITCVLIYSTHLFAGVGTSPTTFRSEDSEGDRRAIVPPGPIPGPRPIIFRPNLVVSKFNLLMRTDTTMKALHADLLARGFQAQTALNNHWGFRGLFKGRDEAGKLQTTNTQFYMRDYTKPGSGDLAALLQIQMGTRKFSFFLIAQNGDFDNATEFARGQDGEISEKHAAGFWHCMWHGLSGIGGTCANALITCPKTGWAAYAGCVALRCGSVALRRLACCACDCSFWCRWAAGCCDR